MIFAKINNIEGVSFLLIVVGDIKVSSGINVSYVVLCSVHITDRAWFRQFEGRDAEILDYIQGNEVVHCAIVDQCADFGVESPGVECYKSVNRSLIWKEYSFWE
jgi:hypothetical protein